MFQENRVQNFTSSEFLNPAALPYSKVPGVEIKRRELCHGFCVSKVKFHAAQILRATVEEAEKRISFSCVLSGAISVQSRQYNFDLKEGNLLTAFAPNSDFDLQMCDGFSNMELRIDAETLWKIAGDEYGKLSLPNDRAFLYPDSGKNPRIAGLSKKISDLFDVECSNSLLIHSASLEFLSWHLDALHLKYCNESVCIRERKKLLAARELLLNDLSKPPTIEQLSRETGLNQLKLKRGFKIMFGDSIYALFQKERMERAKYLLVKNNVTDTAIVLGYSNISHFSNAFRKQFGLLPSEIRKNRF